VVPAGLKTGSDLPYALPQPIAYACLCPYPTPISLQQQKKTTKFRLLLFIYIYIFFIYLFIITSVPSPFIVFVWLTCPDRLSPIPKILSEGTEEETRESISRPNAALEQLPQISAISKDESSGLRTAKGWMVRRGTRFLSILAFIKRSSIPGAF